VFQSLIKLVQDDWKLDQMCFFSSELILNIVFRR